MYNTLVVLWTQHKIVKVFQKKKKTLSFPERKTILTLHNSNKLNCIVVHCVMFIYKFLFIFV